MTTRIYCCILVLILVMVSSLTGCEDRGRPYRGWTAQNRIIVRENDANYFSVEKMDCYVLEFPWPLESGVFNAPINGRRYAGCGGALSSHEAQEYIGQSLKPFALEEHQFVPGLPREVRLEVEKEFAATIDGEVFASALVAGKELFLIRPRFAPSAIVTREGEILYAFPGDAVTTKTVWDPRAHTIVFFDWSELDDRPPGTLLPDYIVTGLNGKVVVHNYAVGDRQEYQISEHKTAEFLLAMEKGEQ